MDLYFERHDGQAVTCDDFVQAMADASGVDLAQFRRWYSQAGTPIVRARGSYDAAAQRYTLALEQRSDPTPGQRAKLPFHIPLAVGLVGPDGQDIELEVEGVAAEPTTDVVLDLVEAAQTFHFVDVPAPPVPSLGRGFSAPVRVEFDYDERRARAARRARQRPGQPLGRRAAHVHARDPRDRRRAARRPRRVAAAGTRRRRRRAPRRPRERSGAARARADPARPGVRRLARRGDRRRRHRPARSFVVRELARALPDRFERVYARSVAPALRADARADGAAPARQRVPALPGRARRRRRPRARRRRSSRPRTT